MDNILDAKANKVQAIIKLEIVMENLEGVHQALSLYEKPKLEKTIQLVDEVLNELKQNMRSE